jgi:energy-coupling factor transport system substrate-specific component
VLWAKSRYYTPMTTTEPTIFQPSAPPRRRLARWLSNATLALIGFIGLSAFLYPFALPSLRQEGEQLAHAGDALLLVGLLIVLSLTVLFAEMESGGRSSSKTVAVLGILTAINAVLRLAHSAISVLNIGGFSPIFFLVILCGYIFGSRFGFLLGALTLLVSAIITGGVGPWLPFQMFTAGWIGMTAGWLPAERLRGRREARAHGNLNLEIGILAAFGFGWGLLYGLIMNLYFWPYASGALGYWTPGMDWRQTLAQYAFFYATTSLWWDLTSATGNAGLLLLFGAAVLKVLRRFQRRFHFETL